MIEAKEYFEQYLAWKQSDSNLRSATFTYRSYSAMDLKTLQLEAEAKSPAALEELGERYLFGLDDLTPDPDRACSLFEEAAAEGNPEAMHMLSEVFRTPEYGKLDYEQYFSWLKKAAEAGCWKSMFNLACACYKGKDAYEGHGFDSDKLTALKWSTKCGITTMQLLEFYFTNPCAEDFTDYMQGVYALFVQSISVSARQLIKGDGVQQDLQWAASMLNDAQSFYHHFFKADCPDFTVLLEHCK